MGYCRYKNYRCPLLSAENSELSMVLSFEPAVGQNIALHASHAVKNSASLNSTVPVHST